jgi:hypothetical protein
MNNCKGAASCRNFIFRGKFLLLYIYFSRLVFAADANLVISAMNCFACSELLQNGKFRGKLIYLSTEFPITMNSISRLQTSAKNPAAVWSLNSVMPDNNKGLTL